MRLSFDTIEEVLAFVERLKKSRGGKNAGDTDDSAGGTTGQTTGGAPAPIMPPPGGGMPAGPFGGAGAPAFAPGGTVAPLLDPAVIALVNRIGPRIDAVIAGGQPAGSVLDWFRTEVTKAGQDASAATMDQIKTVFLAKLSVPALENIAKLIAA